MPTAAAPTVAKSGSRLVERKHSLLTNDLLFHPLDHIRDRTQDVADSFLLDDRLSTPGYETLTRCHSD